MNTTHIHRRTVAFVLAASVGAACLAPLAAIGSEKPFNRVVIGVDASGSYRGRQADALAKAKGLLEEAAKRRVKRWERADEVIVVSLDAIPEEIWRGTTRELKEADASVWQSQFRGRTDYSKCTDVGAFFNLAARELAADPAPTEKYLFVFSDMIAEPPLDSPSKCKQPVPAAQLAQDLPWEALEDVSTTVFWMPVAQKYAWAKVVQEKGLTSKVKLYSESESTGKPLDPPKQAKRKISEERKAESAEALGSALRTFGSVLMGIGGALFAVLGAVALIARARRARRRVVVPGPGQPRPAATTRPLPPQPRPQGTR